MMEVVNLQKIRKTIMTMRHTAKGIIVLLALVAGISAEAQDSGYFRKAVRELSSRKYQGRGYARNGVRKAAKYIAREFSRAGADTVILQPFTLDINTFPGKAKLSVDGRRLKAGEGFTMREFSPGAHGRFKLYHIDTLGYDTQRIFDDLAREENKDCFVVFDFWSSYKHSEDFKRLQSADGCTNAGIVFTWDTPLKFYKAYGERVNAKPVIWVGPDFPRDARSIKADIDNRFYKGYRTENVIAKVSGSRHDSCFVFVAHYDHLGNLGRKLYYPGANDNASGTAGIMSLAAHYAANRPEYDMYFIAFSGEDANLRGSQYFAEHPVMPLESIRYMINLDMIGDNNPVQYCEVSDAGESGFRLFEKLNGEYGQFEKLERGELAANSDHYPFAQLGVPVIFFENENGDAFPYYHTDRDDMSTVRFETFDKLMTLVRAFIDRY